MDDSLKNIVTPDDLMEEFVTDSIVSDDELSDSIFTCVDNYIDDLCISVMDDENSILDSDNDVDTPFTYILDKVMEKVDTIEKIETDEYAKVIAKQLDLDDNKDDDNSSDPDYCEGVDFDEITPEDFQLFINGNEVDNDTYEDGYTYRANEPGLFDDSNFNA
jgi:hypothetical protein